MTRLLGIETSCDETSVAVVDDGRHVLCNLVATQFDLHAKYGGVVPEIASRAHLQTLDCMVQEALATVASPLVGDDESDMGGASMQKASCRDNDIDAIAVTFAPGLIGSLLVGVTAAKTLAWSWGKPLVGVNHIHAHATSAAIDLPHDPWPAIALVVSGGHTSLYLVKDYDEIALLGATIDDAAGEAFDKVAMMLGLGFPGGPIVDKKARLGDPSAIALPRTMLKPGSLDFSFSGLKTAVLYHVHGPGRTTGGLERLDEQQINDLCASFSAAVVEVLVDKTWTAARQTGVKTVVVGGGVAANSMLRERLGARCASEGFALHLTPMRYCTDNAAMIAALGFHRLSRGHLDDLTLSARANVGVA